MTQVELQGLVITPWDVPPEYGFGTALGSMPGFATGMPYQAQLANRFIEALGQDKKRWTMATRNGQSLMPQHTRKT